MAELKIKYDDSIMALSKLSEIERRLLKRSIEIARESMEGGNHPFGALLADKDGNILMEQGNAEVSLNGDCTGHAETQLMKRASRKYSKDEMRCFAMYSSCEPCAMCTGAMYWANLGKMYYVCRESALKEETGNDPRNPTLELPCRAVLACGQKTIEVNGPFLELEDEYLTLHRGYWESR
mgnify:CR=1 FL=1